MSRLEERGGLFLLQSVIINSPGHIVFRNFQRNNVLVDVELHKLGIRLQIYIQLLKAGKGPTKAFCSLWCVFLVIVSIDHSIETFEF